MDHSYPFGSERSGEFSAAPQAPAATERKAFLFYSNWYDAVADRLDKAQQDEFILAIVRYGHRGIVPGPDADPVVAAMFDLIRYALDSDLKKYEDMVNRQRENAEKSAEKRRAKSKKTTKAKTVGNQQETAAEPRIKNQESKNKNQESGTKNHESASQGEDEKKEALTRGWACREGADLFSTAAAESPVQMTADEPGATAEQHESVVEQRESSNGQQAPVAEPQTPIAEQQATATNQQNAAANQQSSVAEPLASLRSPLASEVGQGVVTSVSKTDAESTSPISSPEGFAAPASRDTSSANVATTAASSAPADEADHKPSREEVRDYWRERCLKSSWEEFYDYYEVRSWCNARRERLRAWKTAALFWEDKFVHEVLPMRRREQAVRQTERRREQAAEAQRNRETQRREQLAEADRRAEGAVSREMGLHMYHRALMLCHDDDEQAMAMLRAAETDRAVFQRLAEGFAAA